MLLAKLIVTIGFQFHELTRTLDCRCSATQFSSAEGKRFLPRNLCFSSAFFLACTRLSQVLFSGACGWCSIVWQHRLSTVSVLQKGRLILGAARGQGSTLTWYPLAHVCWPLVPRELLSCCILGNLPKGQGQLKKSCSAHTPMRRDYSLCFYCVRRKEKSYLPAHHWVSEPAISFSQIR